MKFAGRLLITRIVVRNYRPDSHIKVGPVLLRETELWITQKPKVYVLWGERCDESTNSGDPDWGGPETGLVCTMTLTAR